MPARDGDDAAEMGAGYEGLFQALALSDLDAVTRCWGDLTTFIEPLDARSQAFAQLGALTALGGIEGLVGAAIERAIGAGVTADEIVAVLVTLAPVVGGARVIEAAPAFAASLDIDIDKLLGLT